MAVYENLIEEAFIKPIRSALIIDDDYPTIEEILSGLVSDNKDWTTGPEKYLSVVKELRGKNWLLDVNDGSQIDEETPKHLHQTDLLVLDYQLEGSAGDGQRALDIITEIAKNNHFNLVILYTNSPDLRNVFNEILFSLLKTCKEIEDFDESETLDKIHDWENTTEDILNRLLDCIDDSIFLDAYQDLRKTFKDKSKLAKFNSLFRSKPDEVALLENNLFRYLLKKKQNSLRSKLIGRDNTKVDWTFGDENNWLRTDKLFLTVISKNQTHDLPQSLLEALVFWNPDPSRLFLTKIRAELDDNGVCAEDEALSDTLLQAGWLHTLLSKEQVSQDHFIDSLIQKHCHGLILAIQNDVKSFIKKFCSDKNTNEIDVLIKDFYKKDFTKKEIFKESVFKQNVFNCTQKVNGWHLTTGHIFNLNDCLWVCLSPACDLVPEQKNSGRFGELSPALPFKAVKLFNVGLDKGLEVANKNLNLFLELEEKHESFSFIPSKGASPEWSEFYADNFGKFFGNMNLEVGRLVKNKSNQNLRIVKSEIKIVAQLRYEYALNLMQRLGFNLSRIGLDFISHSSK